MKRKILIIVITLMTSMLNVMGQKVSNLEKGRMYWEKAQEAFNKKQYSKTFKNDKKSAELGYPRGMLSLGVCFHVGYGANDYKQAMYWYKKAQEHPEDSWSYSRSFLNMALLYAEGKGVTKDMAKAAQLFAEGVNYLSDDYESWYKSFNKNYGKYINDYKDLAYVSDFFETKGYGNQNKQAFPFKRSFEMRSDFAIKKVKELVDAGNKDASISWAIYLYNDKATAQDKTTAISLWEKYSDVDISQDMLIVAKGDGLYNKAIPKEWYTKKTHTGHLYAAADKGNVEAQFTRGMEYDLKGNDLRRGWYEKAAAQGHAKAKERLVVLNKEKAEKEKEERRQLAAKQEAERKAQNSATKKQSSYSNSGSGKSIQIDWNSSTKPHGKLINRGWTDTYKQYEDAGMIMFSVEGEYGLKYISYNIVYENGEFLYYSIENASSGVYNKLPSRTFKSREAMLDAIRQIRL